MPPTRHTHEQSELRPPRRVARAAAIALCVTLAATAASGSEVGIGQATPAAGADEPLPRFTVGWYCPPPNRSALREALGFGLGVAMIWGFAAHRRARAAQPH